MTIDTSREAVERLLDGVTPGPWDWAENHPLNACASVTAKPDAGWNIGIATLYGDSDNVPTPTALDEPWGDHPIRRADARFIAAARELVPALLAERDAALAEVARLSTPPDDAEVAALVAEVRKLAWSGRDDTADALTRLSQALASETAKREAMEAELRSVEIDLFEAEDKFHIASFYISDEQTKQCVMDRVKWMAKAGSRVRATLAKHGSK